MADKNGGLVRLLGLEIETPESAGLKCQRYAAVVEDGVLLKLVSVSLVVRRTVVQAPGGPPSVHKCRVVV